MANLALLAIADGSSASANINDGQVVRVTPGNTLTVALQSSSGVRRWILSVKSTQVMQTGGPSTPYQGGGWVIERGLGDTFSVTLNAPPVDCVMVLESSTWDGQVYQLATVTLQVYKTDVGLYHRARSVVSSNVNLLACSTTQDGITLANGDRVLLVAQSNQALNGLYVAASISGGNAVLSRPADFSTGTTQPAPTIVEITEGTSYAETTWKASQNGNYTVDTTNLTFYPKTIKGFVALAAGAANVQNLFIQSGAISVASCNSASNVVRAQVPTTGVGNGFSLFNGTLTDGVAYVITNW